MSLYQAYKLLFPSCTWQKPPRDGNFLYLTFDDGPIPELTPWVLDTLNSFQAKATFFCVGGNVKKHSAIYKRIIDEGHQVGNHTYNHLNGWETPNRVYQKNIDTAAKLIKSKLYRPPYGKITPVQLKTVLAKNYEVVMWNNLSKDYDKNISPEKCLERSCEANSGSIIVFHDNLKAEKNLKYALPKFIDWAKKKGFEFKTL